MDMDIYIYGCKLIKQPLKVQADRSSSREKKRENNYKHSIAYAKSRECIWGMHVYFFKA